MSYYGGVKPLNEEPKQFRRMMQRGFSEKGFLALALLPFLLFVFLLVMYTYTFMNHSFTCEVLTLFLSLASLCMIMSPRVGRGGSIFFNPSLGVLCLLATILGSIIGLYDYDQYAIYPMFYGNAGSYSNVVPSQSSASVADAGTLVFSNEAYPDISQSVGFMRESGSVYCVAPIRDGSGIDRIQFWAAGLGCCGEQGSFTCDATGNTNAHAGIVVFDNGGYFSESRLDIYQKARAKAEATYGLQSVTSPIFVRWVETKDLGMLSSSYGSMATFLTVLWTILYGGFSVAAAFTLFKAPA